MGKNVCALLILATFLPIKIEKMWPKLAKHAYIIFFQKSLTSICWYSLEEHNYQVWDLYRERFSKKCS